MDAKRDASKIARGCVQERDNPSERIVVALRFPRVLKCVQGSWSNDGMLDLLLQNIVKQQWISLNLFSLLFSF